MKKYPSYILIAFLFITAMAVSSCSRRGSQYSYNNMMKKRYNSLDMHVDCPVVIPRR